MRIAMIFRAVLGVLFASLAMSSSARTILIPLEDMILPVPKLSITGMVTMTGVPTTITMSISSGTSFLVAQTGNYAFDFDHFGQTFTYRVSPTGLSTATATCTSTPAYRDVSLGPSADTTGVDFTINCVSNPTAANDAHFVSQSIPATMNPGQSYAVSVTMQNAGTATWPAGSTFALGSQNPQDNTTWGSSRISLPSSVAPGSNVTLNFNATAPTSVGYYNFQWRMVTGTTWFGDYSANVAVKVGAADAAFISQTVPTTMVAGRTYPVSVTMKNTGQTTWTAGTQYQLASQNAANNTTWGISSVTLPGSVAPGASVTFTFDVTAPSSAAIYNFQWQVYQGALGFIGQPSTNVAVAVQASSAQGSKIYYVHTDHLGSPREITQSTDNQVVWRWDNTDPFGANGADQSPTGLAQYISNARFPGQYYDSELATHYNMFRDYDSALGRYRESDPLGLMGGLNTYSYSTSKPLSAVDPLGLMAVVICLPPVGCIPVPFPAPVGGSGGGSSSGSKIRGVFPFPVPGTGGPSCPEPDDRCSKDQRVLEINRKSCIEMGKFIVLGGVAYKNCANGLNPVIREHNSFCPKNQVDPLPVAANDE